MPENLADIITKMDGYLARRNSIDKHITGLAVTYVATWLDANDLDAILVDSENERPSFAATGDEDIDDNEDLNQAIGWLPSRAFDNSTPRGGWNPVVRRAALAELQGAVNA